jgi:hypothetical protein
VQTTTVDTGRKEAFGFTARRVITTRKQMPLSGAKCESRETTTIGWLRRSRPQNFLRAMVDGRYAAWSRVPDHSG